MAMPIVVGLIIFTAFLTTIVSTALPYVPKWFNMFKSRIKRKSNATDMVDIIIIAQLTERVNELEEQINNVASNSYNRDKNRKNNIRRDVRDYLKELQNN